MNFKQLTVLATFASGLAYSVFPRSAGAQGLAAPANPPTGSGVNLALGDLDGDGLPEALSVGPDGRLRLFRNGRAGKLVDVTADVGLSGVAGVRLALFEDLDGDGLADLFVSGAGGTRLLASMVTGFLDVTEGSGLAELTGLQSGSSLDYDRDGVADLIVAGGGTSALFHGLGHGIFERVELELAGPRDTFLPGVLPTAELPADAGGQASSPTDASFTWDHGTSRAQSGTSPIGLAKSPVPDTSNASLPLTLGCIPVIRDDAGGCLQASSDPTLGMLYPLTERLFVDGATNRVGIGTTTPRGDLDIRGSSVSGTIWIDSGDPTNEAAVIFGDGVGPFSGGNWAVGNRTNDDFFIDEFGVWSRLTVQKTTGNVGIGTTNPQKLLDVNGEAFLGGSASGHHFLVTGNQIQQLNGASTADMHLNLSGGDVSVGASGGGNLAVGALSTRNGADFDVVGRGSFGDLLGQLNHMLSVRVDSTSSGTDVAIFGENNRTSGGAKGVLGKTLDSTGFGVFSEGDFGGTGAKYFLQPHPTDASKQINFVCLEGNESGTYCRGKVHLAGGRATIDVPEDFRLASEPEGLTVQLTPVGDARVWLERYDVNRVEVRGSSDVEVHYFINGVRRGFGGVQTIRENIAYRPTERGREFGTQYPKELRDLLVQNGILNADYTPNEVTAARLGWRLRDAEALEPATSTDQPVIPEASPR